MLGAPRTVSLHRRGVGGRAMGKEGDISNTFSTKVFFFLNKIKLYFLKEHHLNIRVKKEPGVVVGVEGDTIFQQ